MHTHLTELQQQLQQVRVNEEELASGIRELRVEVERAQQQEEELREQLEVNNDIKRRQARELAEKNQSYDALHLRFLSLQAQLTEAGYHPPSGGTEEQQREGGGEGTGYSVSRRGDLASSHRRESRPRNPPPLVPVHTERRSDLDLAPIQPSAQTLEARREDRADPTQQIVQALSSMTRQLPTIPDFTGEDQKAEGAFTDWIERFEMVAELAQWSEEVKAKQLVLRLRNSAQAFYRTCTEEQKSSYQALVVELSRRFTPVRIQALECSNFHERKQKDDESVDAFAQDLQQLFKKAYPKAALGSEDALEMGQAVLSSQFIGGLIPDIKRKIAYIEGATFSELLQKARFEEAWLHDLSNHRHKESSKRTPRKGDDYRRETKSSQPVFTKEWSSEQAIKQARPIVRCYKCNKIGHYAKECRAYKRFNDHEAKRNKDTSGGARSAAVEATSLEGGQDKQVFEWMYGAQSFSKSAEKDTGSHQHPRLGPTLMFQLMVDNIPVNALLDTGCPATIISRDLCRRIIDGGASLSIAQLQERVNNRLCQPGVLLRAYCGNKLSIGAEVGVQMSAASGHVVDAVVLVQKDAQVDMLLGTDLMGKLGVTIHDADGQPLLKTDNLDIPSSGAENTKEDTGSPSNSKLRPVPCSSIGGKRNRRNNQRPVTVRSVYCSHIKYLLEAASS